MLIKTCFSALSWFGLYLCMICIPFRNYAQFNSYYWSHQYGAKGQLLNGAVIASCDDESAIFYNPAAMSLNEEFGISLSLISPNYGSISTSNLFGKGTSFKDGGIGLSPGLLAARFSPFGSKRIQVGFCSFTRYKSGLQYRDRIVDNTTDGTSNVFTGYLNFESKLDESWLGFGISYRIDSSLAIGGTQFISSRSERTLLDFRKEILSASSTDKLLYGWRSMFEYGYSATGGMLSKFGLIWHPENFRVGLTYTTSTYHIFAGNADYSYDDQKVNENGSSSVESNLKDVKLNDYKTPWSAGFGLEFSWSRKTKVSFSSEYFSKIPNYVLFSDLDDPFNGITSSPFLQETTVRNENESVVNVSLGVQTVVNDNLTFLWGLRTDFSPKGNTEIRQNLEFLANTPGIIHISTGGIVTHKSNYFSVGIDYGFGTRKGGKQITDLANITPTNIFDFGGSENVKTTVHLFNLSLTYDF